MGEIREPLPSITAWSQQVAMEIPNEEIVAIPIVMYAHRDDVPRLAENDCSEDHTVTMKAGGRTLWSLITGCRMHMRGDDNG